MNPKTRPLPINLKPFSAFKEQKKGADDENTQTNDKHIAVFPFEFRHNNVHPIPTRNQIDRQCNSCDDRENLDQVVLLISELRLIGVANLHDVIPQIRDMLEELVKALIENVKVILKLVAEHAVSIFIDTVKDEVNLLVNSAST